MGEENNEYSSKVAEFDAISILQQRLATRKAETSSGPARRSPAFDPHQMMVNRYKENAGQIPVEYSVQNWPIEDIAKLEDFCRRHGIIGFNCGTMSPLAALAFLKNKLGVIENSSTSEGVGPNYPYMEAIKKKILLKG